MDLDEKKVRDNLDNLFKEVREYRSCDKFKEILDFVKKFRNIAPYNAMLLNIQKPGSKYVATAEEWRRDFGRTVKVGARPLVTLFPFGPVRIVFELNDTEGAEFPAAMLNPFHTENKTVKESKFTNFLRNIKFDGVHYGETDYGTESAGFITQSSSYGEQTVDTSLSTYYLQTLYEIRVNANLPVTSKFATVVHELGHLYCGHQGAPFRTWWPARILSDTAVKEFEAECVCWLTCERMGIENPSAEYLSCYLSENNEIPDISIEAVMHAATLVEKRISGSGTDKTRKEITRRVTKPHLKPMLNKLTG